MFFFYKDYLAFSHTIYLHPALTMLNIMSLKVILSIPIIPRPRLPRPPLRNQRLPLPKLGYKRIWQTLIYPAQSPWTFLTRTTFSTLRFGAFYFNFNRSYKYHQTRDSTSVEALDSHSRSILTFHTIRPKLSVRKRLVNLIVSYAADIPSKHRSLWKRLLKHST